MGKIKTVFENFVVGKGIRSTTAAFFRVLGRIFSRKTWNAIKNVWLRFWKNVDRMLGIPAKAILRRHMKIVPNKVFIHTQENRYACNQKYICEELLKENLDLDIVWRAPAGKEASGIPSTVRKVKAGSYAYYREIFSSKVVITNSVLYVDQPIYLKKDQVLIETWHGSLGIKRFGKKDYKSNRLWVKGAIKTGKMTTYCVTNSSFVSDSLRNTYWENTPMLEYGHPRNDLFFADQETLSAIRQKFCDKYNISPEYKFVMYAPTFRDSQDFSVYNIDFDSLISTLETRFGGKWCLLLRYHPSLVKVYKKKQLFTQKQAYPFLNVTDYIDMQELISIADVGITDYSSWIYDFILTRRPGFIYAPDIALYNNERGFCYPLETTPFPISTNNKELIKNVLSFDKELYSERLESFLADKGCVEDGHASERVAHLIAEITGAKKKKDVVKFDDVEFDGFTESPVTEVIDSDYYIVGDRKTEGKHFFNKKNRLRRANNALVGQFYLEKGDKITFLEVIPQEEHEILGESVTYSALDPTSKSLFENVDGKMAILHNGVYDVTYRTDLHTLACKFRPLAEPPKGYYYFLNGNYNSSVDWDGVFNLNNSMRWEDGVFAIRNVPMEAGTYFYVQGIVRGQKNWKNSYAFGNGYIDIDHDILDGKNCGKSIHVAKSGTYDVSIDPYSKLIHVTRSKK